MSFTLGVLLQISVSVQIVDTFPARTAVPLVVRATVNGNTAPTLSTPRASGAAVQLVSDVTRLGGGFGQAVATRETRYVLRASSAGTLTLAPVTATLGSQQATSIARTLVAQTPPTNAVPAIVTRAPVTRRTTVNFHSLVTPDTVWNGEQVTLQVGVFIDDELRSRLQRNPEYVGPSVDGTVGYDLPVANDAMPSREVEGARYRPFVFARALFPLRAGVVTIPPARLVYSLGSAGSMFSRQERQTSTTPERSVFVRELPAAGRPGAFAGAVGVYSMTASVERGIGRVGDAVQLTVRITGTGNVKLLPPPVVSIPGVTASPAGESIAVDSSDLRIRGSKTFRFLLTPQRDGDVPLGTLRYAFFNPVRAAYEEVTAALGALRIAPGTTVADDGPEARVDLIPLLAWTGETATDITERWWFRLLVVAVGLPWLMLIGRRISRLLPKREPWERRQRARGLPTDAEPSAANLRRFYLERLAPIVQLRSDQPFAVPDVVRRLRRAGVTINAAEAAGALLMRLDLLTFGQSATVNDGLLRSLAQESDAVHEQLTVELSSKVRARLQATARVVALSTSLALGTMPSLQAQPRTFSVGADAYRAQRFTEAAAAFADAAASASHSAAAWANLGAAHWMRADTAGAILAWQRSARIAPRGNPSTHRLASLSPSADLRTMLPLVTADTAWLLLLAVAILLSVGGGVWRWRRRQLSNGSLFGATILLALCAVFAALTERAALGEGLVIIRRDVSLRVEPVLAGEAAARARGGEVAIVSDTSSSWLRVSVPGGRIGWVEAEAVRSLAWSDGRAVADAEARIATESSLP